jgi:hypothetical protein
MLEFLLEAALKQEKPLELGIGLILKNKSDIIRDLETLSKLELHLLAMSSLG